MYTSCMGKRGPKPKQLIDTTWRPELAYAVGLLASDGCLSSDGRHVELTSNDTEQLETFKRALGIEHIKIGTKVSGYCGMPTTRVEFGSVLFHAWLVSIGLTPAKSKTIGPLLIPDEYFFDFFRGCWDGDGCIYAYWDPRWRDSYLFYLGVASASMVFVHWLQQVIFRLTSATGHVSVSNDLLQLRYAKREARIVFDHMFYADSVPHLSRKFAKAQKIFRIDENHTRMREW